MASGVARRPITDFGKYHEELARFVYPLRSAHESGVRGGKEATQAYRVRRRRGRARAARRANVARRGNRAADPARPSRRDRAAGSRYGLADGSREGGAGARSRAGFRRLRPAGARVSAPGRPGVVFRPMRPSNTS
jgi:hypothetical protein